MAGNQCHSVSTKQMIAQISKTCSHRKYYIPQKSVHISVLHLYACNFNLLKGCSNFKVFSLPFVEVDFSKGVAVLWYSMLDEDRLACIECKLKHLSLRCQVPKSKIIHVNNSFNNALTTVFACAPYQFSNIGIPQQTLMG